MPRSTRPPRNFSRWLGGSDAPVFRFAASQARRADVVVTSRWNRRPRSRTEAEDSCDRSSAVPGMAVHNATKWRSIRVILSASSEASPQRLC